MLALARASVSGSAAFACSGRLVLAAALALAFVAGVRGGTPKPVKKVHKEHEDATPRRCVADAREDAKNGDYDDADKKYAQAYADTQDFDVLEERVDFLIHNGRAQKARRRREGVLRRAHDRREGLRALRRGTARRRAGQKALEVARAASIDLDDKNPAGHEKKGRALILLGKEEGLEELRKAVQLEPDNAAYNIVARQGAVRARQGRRGGARVPRRGEGRARERRRARLARHGAARPERVRRGEDVHLDKAIELDPHNGRAYFELGLIAGQQNKAEEAEQALAKAVQAVARTSRCSGTRTARCFGSTDRLDEAIVRVSQGGRDRSAVSRRRCRSSG